LLLPLGTLPETTPGQASFSGDGPVMKPRKLKVCATVAADRLPISSYLFAQVSVATKQISEEESCLEK